MKAHNSPSEFNTTEPVHVEFRIDYLQFSTASQIIEWETSGQAIKSRLPYYQYCIEFDSGMLKYAGNPNSDKALYVLSGQACHNLNINPESCGYVINLPGCKVTRLDVCMTVDRFILNKVLESESFIRYPLGPHSVAPEMTVISGRDRRPQTIYLGKMKKRSRKGIVRVYDKALQMGIPGPLSRVEVELRQKDAQKAVKMLSEGYTLAEVMNWKFTIRASWYERLFGEAKHIADFYIEDPRLHESVAERKFRWVMVQVTKSLGYLAWYDNQYNTNYLEQINQRITAHAKQIHKLNH